MTEQTTIGEPLSKLIELTADSLVMLEAKRAEMNRLEIAKKAILERWLPEYEQVQTELENAKLDYAMVSDMMKNRAVELVKDNPDVIKQYGGSIGARTSLRVTHFNEQKAIEFVRRHPENLGMLATLKTNKTMWLNQYKNGLAFPDGIATIEEVIEIPITESKLREFSTIQTEQV